MKKIILIVLSFLLISCNIEDKFDGKSQVYSEDSVIDLSEIIPSQTSYGRLVEKLGPADRYYYGDRMLDVNDLPKAFYMRYNDSLSFRIRDNSIIEMRIEGKSATYGDLYCGQNLDDALTYMTEPEEVLDGFHLYYKENVLYKNFKSDLRGANAYYHDQVNKVRIWALDNVITSIYYLGNEDLLYSHHAYDPKGGSYDNSSFPNFKLAFNYTADKQPDVSSIYILYDVNQSHDFDEIIEYENDPFIKGKWSYKDFVYVVDEFDPSKKRSNFQFIDLDISRYGQIKNSYYAWTKGWIINTNHSFYDIFRTSYLSIEDKDYLVLEWFREKGLEGYYIFEKEGVN